MGLLSLKGSKMVLLLHGAFLGCKSNPNLSCDSNNDMIQKLKPPTMFANMVGHQKWLIKALNHPKEGSNK